MTNDVEIVQEPSIIEEDTNYDDKNSNLEKIMKILVVVLVISLIVTAGLGAYSLLSYTKASPVMNETAETYNYIEEDNWYLFSTNKNNDNIAIFFYPKAKIDEKAYFYLANMLQRRGYDVFISKSLFHQPTFSLSLIDKAMAAYPKHQAWFIGGHGSGAEAIDRYLQGNKGETITGGFYLGLLPDTKTIELKKSLFVAIGSEDGIFNWTEYNQNQNSYFTGTTEIQIIDGGNHTNFGYYELEYDDQDATITAKAQQDIVANRLDKFIIKASQIN